MGVGVVPEETPPEWSGVLPPGPGKDRIFRIVLRLHWVRLVPDCECRLHRLLR